MSRDRSDFYQYANICKLGHMTDGTQAEIMQFLLNILQVYILVSKCTKFHAHTCKTKKPGYNHLKIKIQQFFKF